MFFHEQSKGSYRKQVTCLSSIVNRKKNQCYFTALTFSSRVKPAPYRSRAENKTNQQQLGDQNREGEQTGCLNWQDRTFFWLVTPRKYVSKQPKWADINASKIKNVDSFFVSEFEV